MPNEKLKLTRTLGFEVECFVDHEFYDEDENYTEMYIRNAEVGSDGSLHGGDGNECEVKSDPINDLNIVEQIYNDLEGYSMNVNDTCGLHIHVDTSDYTVEDKARLLRFGSGIELLMFALVESHRLNGRRGSGENEYCTKLHKGWRKLFRNDFIVQNIPFNTMSNLRQLENYVRENSFHEHKNIWNGRYQWLNAQVSHCPTVEFRIFSATEDYRVAQEFGMLAYHIIETVKNSTLQQVRFIIKSIYESLTIDEMYSKLFDSIGLDEDFRPMIKNEALANHIDNKFCLPNRERVANEQQAV